MSLPPEWPQLAGLYPPLADKLIALMAATAQDDPAFAVGPQFGLRTWEQQDGLYALGRTVANPDGHTAAKPLGNIVTQAPGGRSWHNFGLACDVVFRTSKPTDVEGVWHWDWSDGLDWDRLGVLGEQQGLEWGGRWPPAICDRPHFELRAGLALGDVQVLYSQGGLPAVWAEVDQRLKGGA